MRLTKGWKINGLLELREATLRLSVGDRWRLLWEILRSILSEVFGSKLTIHETATDTTSTATTNLNHLGISIHPSWPAEFVQRTAGRWQGEPLVRAPQGEPEEREFLQYRGILNLTQDPLDYQKQVRSEWD